MLDIRDHGGLFGGVNRNKYKSWATGSTKAVNYLVTVNNLSFKPNFVIGFELDFKGNISSNYGFYYFKHNGTEISGYWVPNNHISTTPTITNNGFALRVSNSDVNTLWYAFG